MERSYSFVVAWVGLEPTFVGNDLPFMGQYPVELPLLYPALSFGEHSNHPSAPHPTGISPERSGVIARPPSHCLLRVRLIKKGDAFMRLGAADRI